MNKDVLKDVYLRGKTHADMNKDVLKDAFLRGKTHAVMTVDPQDTERCKPKYRINFSVLYPDGTLIEGPGRVLFSDLTMAAARLSQMADNLDIMVNAGEYKTFTATIERVVETVEK